MTDKMSSGRRLAKRSIVGTRVSVPIVGVPTPGDTLYVPAVIHSTRVLGLETSYCVFFATSDPELRAMLPARKEYRAEQLLGPGFQSVAQAVTRLAAGQRVFLTFKGREVSGLVVRHDPPDQVLLAIDDKALRNKAPDSLLLEPVTHVRRRLDDIRLLESRKSARLLDSDTDYSRIGLEADHDQDASQTASTNAQQGMKTAELPHDPITITQ